MKLIKELFNKASSMNIFFKNLRKKHILMLLGILSTTFSLAQAQGFKSSCEKYYIIDENNTDECCNSLFNSSSMFGFNITVLSLKPNIDDTHFVLDSLENIFNGSHYPKGDRHQNNTSYSPGLSLEGFFVLCPCTSSVHLRGTFFNGHSSSIVSGDFLYDTNGYPGFGAQDTPIYAGTAESNNKFEYYSGDLTYHRNLAIFQPDNVTFIVGAHAAYINFKEHCVSSGNITGDTGIRPIANDLHRDSNFWGIGPQIGIDYQLLLTNPYSVGTLALRIKALGALLCGNTKSDLTYVTLRTGPSGVGVHNGDMWRVITSAEADVGFNYTLNCESSIISAQFGYAFLRYGPCINKITGLDVAFSGDTIDVFNSFNLHGPYIRASIAF